MESATGKVYGLIFGCPLDDEKPKGVCIYNKIWQLAPTDRIKFIKSLTASEIVELDKFHTNLGCKNQNTEKISEALLKKINSLK